MRRRMSLLVTGSPGREGGGAEGAEGGDSPLMADAAAALVLSQRGEEADSLRARVEELEEELQETQDNLDSAAEIGQQMVERLQVVEEENEELRAGTMAPGAIRESEIANLNASLQEAQDDFARVSSELVSAQAQVEWLESQASGVDTEELLSMMDGKDSALQAKDEQISELEGKLADAKTLSKRHSEAEARQDDVARMLRHQVDTLTSDVRRISREKQLAEAMKFAAETKLEATEEKLAKAESEAEHLQRALASKKGSTDQSVKEAAQQMATMRTELQEVKESARLSVAKNAALQEENVELRARARTLEIIPGLGAPSGGPRALAALEEAEEEGGMSLAEEMEDIGVEDENKHDGERLVGLVHFLQEDNVRLSKDKERLAEEFLRLSELVTARSKGGDQKDKMMEVSSIKKTGWLVKRNPQGPIKLWKRRYFKQEGTRLRYFESAR